MHVRNGLQVDISELMLCSGQNASITKGNNSLLLEKRVMVVIHYTFPYQNLATNEALG